MIMNNASQRKFISSYRDPLSPQFDPPRVSGGTLSGETTISETRAGASVMGDGDRITRASDGFLELFGYSMNELLEGCLGWRHLAPSTLPKSEFSRSGLDASSLVDVEPFRKELIRKDGTRILAEIAAVILETAPFRWFASVRPISFEAAHNGHAPAWQDGRVPRPLEPGRSGLCASDELAHKGLCSLEEAREIRSQTARLFSVGFEEFIGSCAPMKRIMELVEQVAPTEATALILGETGTGKELVARAIHKLSRRKDLPFITLNCAAVPAGILESELFGHERGAFTGAMAQRLGRFELANGGTLFLDEVGDMPVELQPKLLRALQEKTIERLGGSKSIPVDVRIIAATNRDLPSMMAEKTFRSELYYRLNVFPITTPPLRERGDDIGLLVDHFTRVYAAKMNKEIGQIPAATLRALSSWPWPGNVRELENFIERSVILSRTNVLAAPVEELRVKSGPIPRTETLDDAKREHVLRVLKECGGVVAKAASQLGLCRTTLNALMARLEIQRKDFR